MRVIVKIGFQEILLPDESGVQQILKLLGKGILVREQLYKGKVTIEDQELLLEMKCVPAAAKFVRASGEDTEEEAQPYPAANGRAKRLNGSQRLLLNERSGL